MVTERNGGNHVNLPICHPLYVVFDVSSPCWFLVMTLLFVILRQKKIDKQNCEYHSCKTCHKSFEEIGGDQSVHFPWDAVKSAHYDSKGCCSNSILFLMCILNVGFWWWYFCLFWENQETKMWRLQHSTFHKSLKIQRWGSMWCISVRCASKRCCPNNMLFLMFCFYVQKSSHTICKAISLMDYTYCSAFFWFFRML